MSPLLSPTFVSSKLGGKVFWYVEIFAVISLARASEEVEAVGNTSIYNFDVRWRMGEFTFMSGAVIS